MAQRSINHYEEVKSMISSTDYIDWLMQYTQERDGFSDSTYFFQKEVASFDGKYIEKLRLFYTGIEQYAQKNHIYPTFFEYGCFYGIRFNEAAFKIGLIPNLQNSYFCKKVALEDSDGFIDFNDILLNKKQDNVDAINESLLSLANHIKSTYKSGVPIQAIISTFNRTIEEIRSQKSDKPAVFAKERKQSTEQE